MLSLDMLYKEVSSIENDYFMSSAVLVIMTESYFSAFSSFFLFFSASVGATNVGQCGGHHADTPTEKSSEEHTELFTNAEVCFVFL